MVLTFVVHFFVRKKNERKHFGVKGNETCYFSDQNIKKKDHDEVGKIMMYMPIPQTTTEVKGFAYVNPDCLA